MRVDSGIIPFKDYWLNCYYNMVFSLLISAEPSYIAAAYLNDYHYEAAEWGIEKKDGITYYNHLQLEPMRKFLKNGVYGVFTFIPVSFRDDRHCLDIIKSHIRQKELLQIGVHLFYWLPGSFNFGVNHWYHYSFINGFDEEKKIFYAFDEDASGYDEHAIPEERFLTAVQNSTIMPHGNIIKLQNPVPPYKFSIDDVVLNAKKIIAEINMMDMSPFWILTDDDFDANRRRDVSTVHIFQITNRHKANEFLFKKILYEYCDSNITTDLVQLSRELQNGWSIIKSQMIRVYKSKAGRKQRLDAINDNMKRLFAKEIKMWNKVVENISQ